MFKTAWYVATGTCHDVLSLGSVISSAPQSLCSMVKLWVPSEVPPPLGRFLRRERCCVHVLPRVCGSGCCLSFQVEMWISWMSCDFCHACICVYLLVYFCVCELVSRCSRLCCWTLKWNEVTYSFQTLGTALCVCDTMFMCTFALHTDRIPYSIMHLCVCAVPLSLPCHVWMLLGLPCHEWIHYMTYISGTFFASGSGDLLCVISSNQSHPLISFVQSQRLPRGGRLSLLYADSCRRCLCKVSLWI